MDRKLLKICRYLDYETFNNATEEQLKYSLQQLCDYFSTKEGRKRIKLDFKVSSPEQTCAATAYINSITLYTRKLTIYTNYLEMFDSVIHESFHQFEYYFLNMPKSLCDDIMWQRVLSYNFYYIVGDQGISHDLYRFNDFEIDAYRRTDMLLKTIYNKLKSDGKDVERLKKYIKEERQVFSKDLSDIKKRLGEKAKQSVDDFYIKCAVKYIRENENIEDIPTDELLSRVIDGEYIYSISNDNQIVDISQKFINNAYANFTTMLPHLYGKTKHVLYNADFTSEL